ncbi:MAG: hypothetical protein ABIN97_05310 [Ginsengibacter sp.]
MKPRNIIDIGLNILLPIAVGSLIYYWNIKNNLTGYIRNQLPDGLWAYAFVSSILIVWNRQINIYWLLGISVIYVGIEILQYLNIIAGTGDILDVAVYFAFSILGLLTNRIIKKTTNKYDNNS